MTLISLDLNCRKDSGWHLQKCAEAFKDNWRDSTTTSTCSFWLRYSCHKYFRMEQSLCLKHFVQDSLFTHFSRCIKEFCGCASSTVNRTSFIFACYGKQTVQKCQRPGWRYGCQNKAKTTTTKNVHNTSNFWDI